MYIALFPMVTDSWIILQWEDYSHTRSWWCLWQIQIPQAEDCHKLCGSEINYWAWNRALNCRGVILYRVTEQKRRKHSISNVWRNPSIQTHIPKKSVKWNYLNYIKGSQIKLQGSLMEDKNNKDGNRGGTPVGQHGGRSHHINMKLM